MKRLALLIVAAVFVLPPAPAQAAGTFTNPLNASADPTLTYFHGSYYPATTLGDRIGIWRSSTLGGLASVPETTVWRVDANHRNYVIESDGDDPLGPYHFKARIADWDAYAIDGEPIVHNGRTYLVRITRV